MNNWPESVGLTENPVRGYFVELDRFLHLQRFDISEPLPPISEDESVLLFVFSGSGRITINGVVFTLEPGSLAWLQSYHTYTIEPAFGETLSFAVCIYDYPLSSYLVILKQTNEISQAIMNAMPVIALEEKRAAIIGRLLQEFGAENESGSRGSSMIKVAVSGQIITFFIAGCIRRVKRESESQMPLGWMATLYIAAHYREDISAKSVSEHFGCTSAELNRELRKISGLNFVQTLDRVRINIACGAMFFEDVSLSYLLSYSGFSTEAAFYRLFKRYKGMSPNEYRAMRLNRAGGGYSAMIGSRTVMSAMNYIQENYAAPITQKSIAADLYISEALINERFQSMFGMSCRQIIMLCRVRHAEPLLLNTDLPLLDIAIRVGFNSTKVFARAFRRVNGISPGEYRQSAKGGKNGAQEEE